MLWVKYDLSSRHQYLPELLKCVNMSYIPLSYFNDNIKNEEILQSDFTSNKCFENVISLLNTFVIIGFLDAAQKMYDNYDNALYPEYYLNRRYRMKKNQVRLKYYFIIFFQTIKYVTFSEYLIHNTYFVHKKVLYNL